MPFKGIGKCGRCRRKRLNYFDNTGIYAISQLKIEIIIPNKNYPNQKTLRITCPKGHTYISRSKEVYSFIRRMERHEIT